MTKQIKIIDFGESSFSNEERKNLNTPLSFRAPESYFSESIGPPADIWAFACTIFEVFGMYPLFEEFMYYKDSILLEMIETLGILPE